MPPRIPLPPPTHHIGVRHDIELADLPKVLVQHLDEAMYELKHLKFVLGGVGWVPSGLAEWRGRVAGTQRRIQLPPTEV